MNYVRQAYLYFLFHHSQGFIFINYQMKTAMNISLTGLNSFSLSLNKSLNLTSGFHRESQNKWPALPPLWSHHKPEVTLSGRFKKVQPPHPPTHPSGCRECRCASACSSPECWKVILEGISEQGSSHFVHTLFLSLQRQVPLPPPKVLDVCPQLFLPT